MKQTKMMSFVESLANVGVGYGLAVGTQILVFPLFGVHVAVRDNLLIGLLFTGVSIARSFALRRMFEAVRARRGRKTFALDLVKACLMKEGLR